MRLIFDPAGDCLTRSVAGSRDFHFVADLQIGRYRKLQLLSGIDDIRGQTVQELDFRIAASIPKVGFGNLPEAVATLDDMNLSGFRGLYRCFFWINLRAVLGKNEIVGCTTGYRASEHHR